MIVHYTQRKHATYRSVSGISRAYGLVMQPSDPNKQPGNAEPTCLRLHPAGQGHKRLIGCWIDVPIDCIPEVISRMQDFYRAHQALDLRGIS